MYNLFEESIPVREQLNYLLFFIILLINLSYAPLLCSAPRFLAISDIHYSPNNTSKDGSDTGPDLLDSTMHKLKKLSNEVDFILYLGDLPTHGLFLGSAKAEYEKTVFENLLWADTAAKPMFYSTGNNDSLGGNFQAFTYEGKSPLDYATGWTGSCAYCEGLVIDDSHMYTGGYYSSYVLRDNKEVILIVLNTIQFAKTSIFTPKYPNQEHDALEQLSWLEEQLNNYHAKQLLIAMHVAPGFDYHNKPLWQEKYLKAFVHLLDQYHNRYGQVSLVTSHSHMDELRKIVLEDGTAIYGISTPGISRVHHNNPGMKVFYLNNNYEITNFTTYFTPTSKVWDNQSYQAIGGADPIFPHCLNMSLRPCLDSMSTKEVCANINRGNFETVKSTTAPDEHCDRTYEVITSH